MAGLHHNLKVIEGNDCDCWSFWFAKKLVFERVKQNLGLDRVRTIGIGAAPLSRETLEYFLSLDIVLSMGYGMSETTGPHTLNCQGLHHLGSVGPTMDGLKTKILDPDTEGNGEICFNSRNIMMGYLNKPDETKVAIENDGWLHSGDIGFEQDGFITITGRIKDLIITAGGENIPPILIEDSIKEFLPCVSFAFVVGDKKKFLSCLLTLQVEIDKDSLEPKSELASAAREWCLKHGIKGTTIEDVLTGPDDERFVKAVQDGIDCYNQVATSNSQKIQKFVVLPTDFSLPGGELGPTMKVKRHYVLQKYESVINTMYTV